MSMGNALCCKRKSEKNKIVLLLLGLDNAGKTVAAKNLAGVPIKDNIPTVGFSIVNLEFKDYDVHVFDLGGRSDLRSIWERYYVDAHGVMFVIDSNDGDRLAETHVVLSQVLSHEKIRRKPILILANKQDGEFALDEIDLVEKLDIERLVNEYECPALMESCAATQDIEMDGIKRGYQWLVNYIIREYALLNARVQTDITQQKELDKLERLRKIERLQQLSCDVAQPSINGFNERSIFVVSANDKCTEISDSTKSCHSILDAYPEVVIPLDPISPQRPKSSTSIVRSRLETDKQLSVPVRRIKSANSRTIPMQLYTPTAQVDNVKTSQSAKERVLTKDGAQRNLKSAGDYVTLPNAVIDTSVINETGDLKDSTFSKTSNHLSVFEVQKKAQGLNGPARFSPHYDNYF